MRTRPLLAILASLFAAGLCVEAASARPSPAIQEQRAHEREVVAQIDQIGRSLEQVVQDYDGAQIRLHRVERGLQLNGIALGVARRNLKAAQGRLAARLVSLYENGAPGALDVLAGATSLSQIIDRLESARLLSKQDAALGQQTTRFKGSVQRRETLLRRQRRERAATVASLAARRRTIESALAEQQRLLASIHTTIADLQAQEAARQRRLAALARERIARALAARQAAQRRMAARESSASDPPAPAPTPAPAPGLVASPAPPPVPVAPSSSGAGHPEAAQIAARYLGVPYVWGGASPSGFDCSGLVEYVYAQLGISLPHYTVSQWNATIPISVSELAPGDLVFFDGLGHVGIYIGGGQFIHAPHTGTVVQVSSLSGYYASALVGARRVP
jgi:cell wall-associated NlpC family hydrolase